MRNPQRSIKKDSKKNTLRNPKRKNETATTQTEKRYVTPSKIQDGWNIF